MTKHVYIYIFIIIMNNTFRLFLDIEILNF
jgi:hypothetical protein